MKGKWTERKRNDTRRVPRTVRAAAAIVRRERSAPIPQAPRVIRATRYAVKPMSVEDAAVRIEDSAEPFVVFRNAESSSRQHPLPAQGRAARADRAGLTEGPQVHLLSVALR